MLRPPGLSEEVLSPEEFDQALGLRFAAVEQLEGLPSKMAQALGLETGQAALAAKALAALDHQGGDHRCRAPPYIRTRVRFKG